MSISISASSSITSARSLPFGLGPLADGKVDDSNVAVAGVAKGVLLGVGFAGQASSGEVMAGAVDPFDILPDPL